MESSVYELIKETFSDLIDLKVNHVEDDALQINITALLKALKNPKINYELVQEISQKGYLVNQPNLRSLCWKMFFKYIGVESSTWKYTINKKRVEYEKMKQAYMSKLNIILIKNKKQNASNNINNSTKSNIIINFTHNNTTCNTKSNNNTNNDPKNNNIIKKQNPVDHPLSTTTSSRWNNYFEDLELLEKIDQDIRRTRQEITFFTQSNSNNQKETNQDVMKRILFLYSKDHNHVKYVQGLNEVLAIIYYCFSNERNSFFSANIEADTYFCFVQLMEKIESMYIAKLDNTKNGIEWKLFNVKIQLRDIDIDIFNALNDNNIDFHFFAFKWFTLLFTQEYSMNDALRLWDWILTFEDIFECLKLLSLSALRLKKKTIIYGNFPSIVSSLQTFDIEVETLITTVNDITRDLERFAQETKDK